MGSTTPIHGLHYPSSGDAPNGPAQIEQLADDLDAALPVVTDTAPAAPVAGLLWYAPTADVLKFYDGTQWQTYKADTGWVNLTGLGGSYTTPSTVGAGQAQFRVVDGIVYMQGVIQTVSGSPFPANTTVLLIASGNLPPQIVPAMSINRALASTNPAAFARGIIGTGAGTMSIATSAAPGSYVDIGGFSGYGVA